MGVKGKKAAFVYGTFLSMSGTCIINQVAGSIDRGIKI